MDLYETLGIDKGASKQEIKKAFKSKSQKLHPDKGGNKDEFSRLVIARDVLLDDNRRKQYDDNGSTEKPMTIDSQAMQRLADMFCQSLQNPSINIVNNIKNNLLRLVIEFEKEKTRKQYEIEKITKLMNRIYCNADFNLFESTLQQKIDSVNESLKRSEYDIAVAEKCLEIIEDYKDSFVETKPIISKQSNYVINPTSFYGWKV